MHLCRSHPARSSSVASLVLALLVAGCGPGGDTSGGDGNYYYHWNCHGDSECLALNPAIPSQASGTVDEGPDYQMCAPLLAFSKRFWNKPPATDSCDHSPTDIGDPLPPAAPTIAGFTPITGAPGTSVTVTGTNFPTSVSAVTVKVGGVVAVVSQLSATQLVIAIPPALGNSIDFISVTTAGGSANSAQSFTVVVPDPLAGVTIQKIAPGADHVCAIVADGSVRCWGKNELGQLGNGTTVSSSTAVTVVGIANAIDIASGSSFSCAVVGAAPGATSGSVSCWGSGASGQLGNGATSDSATPVVAGAMTTAFQVTARAGHACAVITRGDVLCWGDGTSGQLGNNTTISSAVPVNVIGTGADNYTLVNTQGLPASTKAYQVSAGDAHTCARVSITSGGLGLGVVCWGATNHGELGNGAPMCLPGTICDPKPPSPVPQRVSGVVSAAHIAAGGHHSCVALTTGGVRCWGQGDAGQLGYGGTQPSSTPLGVTGVTGATHVSAGALFSCVSASGALKCWGANDVGELGNGLTANSTTPLAVTAIAPASYGPDTLRGGNVNTCLRRSDGTAFCFP